MKFKIPRKHLKFLSDWMDNPNNWNEGFDNHPRLLTEIRDIIYEQAYQTKIDRYGGKLMTEKLPTFPKTQLVSLTLIKQLTDKKEIIHCQTLANSVEEAVENAKTKYGNVELNAWGARMLPGEDGSILHGGGPLVPSKYDDYHPKAIAAINPEI